eukprot:gnl/MRDRNA2_/MRDRNA2_75641_c0_seq1.p1 gnl/MRDRNA2_/MRDRNA2_75641_c0~~gnl/MRDRNA2_/MRDRNA2_75641_c0_seq1.p1  ORF type:complete len:865 (+),score=136.20 gnl/MRDRNA2_/MRDRNA2_75641_c0_seq1:41-2596(+)
MLDAGAGQCPCRKAILEARPDLSYIAQDFGRYESAKRVDKSTAGRILRTGYCDPLDITSDITSIPLANSSVDVIYCASVLEHVPDAVLALRELARLLRAGGALYISVPFGGGLHNLPYHFTGGYTFQWFEHHGASFDLKVKDANYAFTPQTTDLHRLIDTVARWGHCLAGEDQVKFADAAEALLPIFSSTIPRCSIQRPEPSRESAIDFNSDGANRLEMLFPDAIEVTLMKAAPQIMEINETKDTSCNNVIEKLDKWQCVGLNSVQLESPEDGKDSCKKACCAAHACEIWQYNPSYGCFVGTSQFCYPANDMRPWEFAAKAVGERLRDLSAQNTTGSSEHRISKLYIEKETSSLASLNSAQIASVAFMVHMDGVVLASGDQQQLIIVHREVESANLQLMEPCWSKTRSPSKCCLIFHPAVELTPFSIDKLEEYPRCWNDDSNYEWYNKCCLESRIRSESKTMWLFPNIHLVSKGPMPEEIKIWELVELKIPKVDEVAFDKKRQRWRYGNFSSSPLCPSLATQGVRWNRSARSSLRANWEQPDAVGKIQSIEFLLDLLQDYDIPLRKTFVNLGAGNCKGTAWAFDPLYTLLFSRAGQEFKGLAVEAMLESLQECVELVKNSEYAPKELVPVHTEIKPNNIQEILRVHGPAVFPELKEGQANRAEQANENEDANGRSPLDILVVDIDSWDCAVAAAVVKFLRPKIINIEVNYQIPPPFRFNREYDPTAAVWREDTYTNSTFMATVGCSLSYATKLFGELGYYLLFIYEADAVFIDAAYAWVFKDAFSLQLPQDEIECYRLSILWAHDDKIPAEYMREWFFSPEPEDSFSYIRTNLTALSKAEGLHGIPFTLTY